MPLSEGFGQFQRPSRARRHPSLQTANVIRFSGFITFDAREWRVEQQRERGFLPSGFTAGRFREPPPRERPPPRPPEAPGPSSPLARPGCLACSAGSGRQPASPAGSHASPYLPSTPAHLGAGAPPGRCGSSGRRAPSRGTRPGPRRATAGTPAPPRARLRGPGRGRSRRGRCRGGGGRRPHPSCHSAAAPGSKRGEGLGGVRPGRRQPRTGRPLTAPRRLRCPRLPCAALPASPPRTSAPAFTGRSGRPSRWLSPPLPITAPLICRRPESSSPELPTAR